MPQVSVEPGWYKDPADPTVQRWWDGEGWVGEPLPADATPPPGPPPASPPAGHAGAVPAREPQVPAVPGMTTTEAPPRWADIPPRRISTPTKQVWRPPAPGAPAAIANQPPPRPHGYTLATPGARLLARLIDIGLVFLLNVAVNGWFVYQYWLEVQPLISEVWRRSLANETSMADLPQPGPQAGNLQIAIVVIAAALWFAYEVPAVANTGQTPGKRLLKIKVVRLESDQPLGFGRSFRRWNTMGLPTLLWICMVGFILQFIDALFVAIDRPLYQALHDKSAHTAVVAVPSKEAPNEPAHPSRP